jgi:hypothetical protein
VATTGLLRTALRCVATAGAVLMRMLMLRTMTTGGWCGIYGDKLGALLAARVKRQREELS